MTLITLFVAALTAGVAHATEFEACTSGLTEITVEMDRGAEGASEHLRRTVDWRALSKHEAGFVFAKTGKVKVGVIQTPYLAEDFRRQYSAEQRVSDRLIETYESDVATMRSNWKMKLIGKGLKLVGQGAGAERILERLPGETSQILVQIAGKQLVTRSRSGQHPVKGIEPSLSSVEELLDTSFIRQMDETIAAHLKLDFDRPLEITMSLIHLCPGLTAPLSPQDSEAVLNMSKKLSDLYPYLTLRTRIVSVAALARQGDLYFVREVVAPARHRLSDLLKRRKL